jgi:hypothetical protein
VAASVLEESARGEASLFNGDMAYSPQHRPLGEPAEPGRKP